MEESISAFNSKFPIPMEFSLSYGPLAFLHIRYIKDPQRVFRKKDLLHFLPSFLLDGIFFTAIFLFIRVNMDWAYENILIIQSTAIAISLLGAIQLSIYTYLIYRESVEAKRILREFEKIKKWLNSLVISWSILIGFIVLSAPIALLFIEDMDANSALLYKPLGIFITSCIYFLGYLYLLKYVRTVDTYSDRIAKFSFSPKELNDKKDQILRMLTEKKVYQDPKLTVAKLAGHLNWPINNVSSIINESFHTNFNDLISQHRILEFKNRLLEPDSLKYSIIGLAKEVGFSSKASFYRAFKKETGMTPSDYINSQA